MRFAALAVAMLFAGDAFADCAMARSFLAPENGSVPPNAMIHAFIPYSRTTLPEVVVRDGAGKEVPHSVSAQPSSDAFSVFRIDVKAGDADALVVSFADRDYRYTVKPERYPARAASIDAVGSKSYAWTCSHHSTRDLSVSPQAPVYRVVWGTSETRVREGKGEQVLLPHRAIELAYRYDDKAQIPADAVLQLGHLNCTGYTVARDAWLVSPIWASVVAIYPDGSESPASAPVRLDAPEPDKLEKHR